MAGSIPELTFPNSPFFNIYNDAPTTQNSPNLPSGPCNFVDLTHGANGPKCGCRRFWSRATISRSGAGSPTGTSLAFSNRFSSGNINGLVDETAWCMCSHHACFHDDIRDTQPPVAIPANTDVVNNGQENERPSRGPLTPVVSDLPSFKMPAPSPLDPNMDLYTFNDAASLSSCPLGMGNALPNEMVATAPEPSIPDTMSWADLIQSGPDEGGLLPPIPSQCLMSSQPSSTTSSARIGYLRPFAGKGLQTLSGVKSRLGEPPLEQDDDETQPQEEEIVAHSVDHSVDDDDDGQTVANTPRPCDHADITETHDLSPFGPDRGPLRELSDAVQGHERRLDRLENPSISVIGHDVCDEKHDQTDLKITELETRVEEVEKMINDNSSQISSHRPRPVGFGVSTSSVASVSTVGSEYIASRAELFSQLQVLRSQLGQLQGLSSFPSHARPWEVEVVFLPFPLKSVWMETHDFASQHPSNGGSVEPDHWTQLPNSASFDFESPDISDWAGPELESDWLLPRACAPGRTIEQRLKSRGLVKNVTIRGSDARSVQQAMSEAFGTLFRTFSRMQANVYHGSTEHHRVSKFLGLQSPWIPLRKIHKDSRLRFLSPPEMVTPATWDVAFLRSSVVMKATGIQRLFITHPEAYLQDQDAYDNGWNWQRLRELSRVYADSQSSQEVPEADAMEDCWAWNDTLDEHATSTRTSQSLSLRHAAQRNWRASVCSQGLRAGTIGLSPSLGTRRSVSRTKSPALLKERHTSKPPYIRTTSMPPAAVPLVSPAQTKRKVPSYVYPFDRRPSPQIIRVAPTTAYAATHAKRRNTRSPSARPRNTPRWSTASPSPMGEAFVARGTTPFYATPYSNAPVYETRPGRSVVIIDDVDDDMGESGSGTDHEDGGDGYMDEDEDEDADDTSENNDSPMIDMTHPGNSQESWQDGQLPGPEDEPWPGIEDAENRDPDLGISIHIDDDAMTDADDFENDSQKSSVPSEYPSTQRAWTGAEEGGFQVYEDGVPIIGTVGVGK
ncbi:uncharacterized protein GGS25DRAFT_523828 [Hypoxylon fragiforme]|uniref:uncharacterized protein n=1 Tax=Hypoxylon fragiforme TaxID=63214 RepID=UPI0020C6BA40|nr:uncharacterized protein GGS25DRAFT_523828 [Hypoxylon fragiforme]KAI2606161.1 hypothetical protein GGS25DRAFT_523828 [Hypoxylon fragiforme]